MAIVFPYGNEDAEKDGSQVTVEDTSTIILEPNASRKYARIKNIGAATCYIRLGLTSTTSYYPLDAGETIELFLYGGRASAVCSAGSSTTLSILAY